MTLFSINRIGLRNFRCHADFDLTLDGQDVSIFGRNFLGKSSIGDAVSWVLFGKNLEQRASFEIRPLDKETLQPIPGLETTVEVEFEIGGKPLALARTYKEVWTKKRGSAQSERTGNTTEYKVQGVPVSEAEYKSRVAGICDERTFRTLTSPTFFNSDEFGSSKDPAWQQRRALLLEITGDVSDEDVINSQVALLDLPEILGDYSIEDFRKIVSARRKALNDEIGAIPIRIDQATKAMPVASAMSIEESDAIITDYRKRVQACHEKRAQVAAGGAIAEKTTRIRAIEGELLVVKNRLAAGAGDEVAKAQTLARAKEAEVADAENRHDIIRGKIRAAETQKSTLEAERARLIARWKAINERTYTGENVCPACQQPLPEDQVADAVAAFNERKSEDLARNREAGVATRKQLDDLTSKLAALSEESNALDSTITDLKNERIRMPMPTAAVVDPESDPEYRTKLAEKASLESDIKGLREGATAELQKIDEAIANNQTRLSEAESAKTRIEQKARIEQQITELKAREKELASRFEALERELFLIEEFVRTKVSMLEGKINDRFAIAGFKLFEPQENGGLRECCEAVKKANGVPYRDLSTSEKINVGLDILNVIADYKGFAPFVVIDNCESNHDPLPTHGQQIRLVVSPSDTTLRFVPRPRPVPAEEPALRELFAA